MTVLVLGAAGMLGHKVLQAIPDAVGTVRRLAPANELFGERLWLGVDATDWNSGGGAAALDEIGPNVIVNCVGVIKQRHPEVTEAIEVNSLFPHRLATYCGERGIRLIHISTDCVFSGRHGPYSETDRPDASDTYGRSKILGEPLDREGVLTLRTSIIGRELTGHLGLVEWFLTQHGTVPGYARAFFSGVTTNWLASAIATLIDGHPDLWGLYHVAGGRISKAELLSLLAAAYNPEITVEDVDVPALDRSLDGSGFVAATGIETPSWPAMIAAMASDPTPYDQWR